LLVASGFLLWATCILFTLHGLQVVQRDAMRTQARRQQERVVKAEPRRGKILDRMGRPLAVSTAAYTVYAASAQVREEEGAVERLAQALGLPEKRVRGKLSREGFILLARRLAPDVADRIRREKIPGVQLVTEARRFYPRGRLAAHVLGFVVPDNEKLREGLESKYDEEIRGIPGAYLALRDARGRHIRMEARQESVPGNDIVTSLDEVIQHIAERELKVAIRESSAKAGTVVVLHTPTGELLALANHPTFNPNRYGKSRAAARRNRAVMDYYEPGSTFKVVTAAAAIEEGLVRSSEAIDCGNGLVRVAGVTIRDHKPFGILSFREAIGLSSNGCAIQVGLRLPAATFHDYITRFGFGSRTGIDLPGETKGLLRPSSGWSATSQAFLSFGQEIGVSALQVAAAFSAIANGGVDVPPRVVKRILEPRGQMVRLPEPPPRRRVVREATAGILVDLLESAVYEGTGEAAGIPGHRVAGKTGTAQKYVGGETYSEDQHISSFCGFVPARRPVLTIHVILDEPEGKDYHGGDVAAPVFRKIAEPSLDYLGVPREPWWSPMRGGPLLASAGRGGRGLVPASSHAESGPVPGGGAVRRVIPKRYQVDAGEVRRGGSGHEEPPPGPVVLVPDLRGVSLRDAVVGLARIGLRASVRGEGFVVSQAPSPRSEVELGATVVLELARSVRTAVSTTGAGR
jgi:cell division protein FtsI (penicillin-binding protein 3)